MTQTMADRRQGTPAKDTRDARLKAALKANIARRKARASGLEKPGSPPQEQGDSPQTHPEEE